jgi:RHS repeat-associated protein
VPYGNFVTTITFLRMRQIPFGAIFVTDSTFLCIMRASEAGPCARLFVGENKSSTRSATGAGRVSQGLSMSKSFVSGAIARHAGAVLFSLAVVSLPLSAAAQSRWGEEYAKRIHASEQVSPLTDDMFGDHVSLYNGTVEFRTTDISLPGNSDLPVELTRTFDTQDSSWPTAIPTATGPGWQIDAPYLSGTFAQSDMIGLRCTNAGNPPSVTVIGDMDGQSYIFNAHDYWSGNHLHAPGGGGELLAKNGDAKVPKPNFTVDSGWTTKDGWYFSCLPQVQQRVPVAGLPPQSQEELTRDNSGLGFVGYAPDGKKYTFDWKVVRPLIGEGIVKENDTGTRAALLAREDVRLYATKVEDRFGNWVQYHWQGNELVRIDSNDGRAINLNYSASGMDSGIGQFRVLISATAAGRTWTYNYGPTMSVVLPDGSSWKYAESTTSQWGFLQFTYPQGPIDPHNMASPQGDIMEYVAPCTRLPRFDPVTSTLTVTHPSGAQAAFTFVPMRHGRTNVTYSCANHNPDGGFPSTTKPLMHDVMSLTQKRITGPGLSQGDYTYSYAGLEGDFDVASAYSTTWTPAPHYKTVTVTQPDGTQVINSFGKDYGLNEGQLAKVQVVKGGTTYRTTTNTYIAESDVAAQPFPDKMGTSVMQYPDQWGSAAVRPLVSTTLVQDGVTFSTNNGSFDQFAKPTSVTRSSSGNAGGDSSRIESMTYKNDLDRWLLGLPLTTTCTSSACAGMVMSETRYDPNNPNDLPWQLYSYGVLQATMTYNADGTLATVADGAGNVTTLSSWKRGVPQTIHFPNTPESPTGAIMSSVVNDSGWLTAVSDEMGFTTNYGYDPMGRMSQVTYPTGDTTAWASMVNTFTPVATPEYGLPAGHWKSTTQNGYGLTTTYYDAHWRPVLVQSEDTGNSATRKFVVKRYDILGREIFSSYPVASVSSINDALQGVTTTYDALGRATLVQQNSELGTLTSTTQYLIGFKTKSTNPRLFSTTTSYQVFDSPSTDAPVSMVQDIKLSPLDQVTTTITRDVFGKPTAITRSGTYNSAAVSATRNYVYDANQRLCKSVNPESYATLVDYDAAGNIAWSADGNALTGLTCNRGSVLATDKTTRTYDARNRTLSVVYPGSTAGVSYAYFADGALKTLTSGSSHWDYTYNKRRMPLTEQLTLGTRVKTISHTYNWEGFESFLTYPSGLVVPFTPNGLGQVTQAGGYATGVTYHPNGGMSVFIYGNGIVHSMVENLRQLPQRSLDQKPGSPSVLDDSYDYDYNGNVAAITDGVIGGGGNRNMTYDGLDRLTATSAPNLAWINATTSYDPLDNIRSNTVGARTWNYSYNTLNRLTQLATPSGTVARNIGYDARGNITVNGSAVDAFDTANRLTTVTGKESYLYDGYGRRVQIVRLSDNKISYPLYSMAGQLIMDEDQRSGKTTDYVTLNGSLVAKRTAPIGTTTWATFYEHTDSLHTPVSETDVAGTATMIKRYTPYGEPSDGNYVQGPAFAGHVTDAATGLSYMQQRYYDPVLGRFLSVDPVPANTTAGGNFNRYWYGSNNPYKMIDPDGRSDCPWYIPWCASTSRISPTESDHSKDEEKNRRNPELKTANTNPHTNGGDSDHKKQGILAKIFDALTSTLVPQLANEIKRPEHPTKMPAAAAARVSVVNRVALVSATAGTVVPAAVGGATEAAPVAYGAAESAVYRYGPQAVLAGCMAVACSSGEELPHTYLDDIEGIDAAVEGASAETQTLGQMFVTPPPAK